MNDKGRETVSKIKTGRRTVGLAKICNLHKQLIPTLLFFFFLLQSEQYKSILILKKQDRNLMGRHSSAVRGAEGSLVHSSLPL